MLLVCISWGQGTCVPASHKIKKEGKVRKTLLTNVKIYFVLICTTAELFKDRINQFCNIIVSFHTIRIVRSIQASTVGCRRDKFGGDIKSSLCLLLCVLDVAQRCLVSDTCSCIKIVYACYVLILCFVMKENQSIVLYGFQVPDSLCCAIILLLTSSEKRKTKIVHYFAFNMLKLHTTTC